MRRIGLAVVLAVNLLLAPLAVDAQPSEKVYSNRHARADVEDSQRGQPSVLGRADQIIE